MVRQRKRENGRITVPFLFLMVIGSVAIFILGVMVGSNVRVPSEADRGGSTTGTVAIPREVSMEPAAGSREEVLLEEEGEEEIGVKVKGEELTFYETLAEKGEPPVAVQEPPDEKMEEAVAKKAPLPESATAAKKVEKKEAVSSPAGKPQLTGGRYAVQIMALSEKARAQAEVDRLSGMGYDAYMAEPLVRSRGTLYRIRVGRFRSRDEAQELRREMVDKLGFEGAFIVSD